METLDIPVNLEIDDVKGRLHLKNEGNLEQVRSILEIANPLISARAFYKIAFVEDKLEDGVIIEETRFTSHVLRKNLDKVGRIFPYVVTLGAGLEERAGAGEDLLEQYYLDVTGNVALLKARKYLEEHLRSKFALDGMSYMSPGSLEDWPIEEQSKLFSILEDVEASIGVKLSESLLMLPKKSISGIYFPTEVTFYSCQLCPREQCEGRKASYNKKLAQEYGILK